MISKTQRWLDLLTFLLGRRFPATIDQIFAAVPAYSGGLDDESSTSKSTVRRMFERDKDELRSAGIPIETVQSRVSYGTEVEEGYQLRATDFYLPQVQVTARDEASVGGGRRDLFQIETGELEVTIAALREAIEIPDSPFAEDARSALRKLTYDLELAGGAEPVSRVGATRDPMLLRKLELFSEGLMRRKRIAFTYRSPARPESTQRDVATYGILFERGMWYVIGHDELRDDVRVFRVDRAESPMVNRKSPGKADYEIPADFSLEVYRDRKAWQYTAGDEPTTVHVSMTESLSRWADHSGLGRAVDTGQSDRSARTFAVQSVGPFVDWVLGLDGRALITGPPEVVDEFCARAKAIHELHAGGKPRGQ
jgi:proteasome accessory factor B